MKYTSKLILNWEEYQFAAPEQWRQPWANTIAYYPFDTDYVDASGNSPTATKQGTNIWLHKWIDCLDLNNSFAIVDWINNLNNVNEFTLCVWVYPYWKTWINYYWNANRWGSWFDISPYTTWWIRWWNTTDTQSSVPAISEWWHLLAQIWVVGWAGSRVVDGQWTTLIASWLTAPGNQTDKLYIGALADGTWANSWYMSKLILEDKAWSVQEMTNYFNQTKSLYGIS